MTEEQKKDERPVVICTKYRGVFFGYTNDTSGHTVTLSHARMCVYWEKSIRGVLGLASHGPSSRCRIGNPVQQIELRGVTAVIEVTPEAAKKWEASPWS
jgi:hypothetical protein